MARKVQIQQRLSGNTIERVVILDDRELVAKVYTDDPAHKPAEVVLSWPVQYGSEPYTNRAEHISVGQVLEAWISIFLPKSSMVNNLQFTLEFWLSNNHFSITLNAPFTSYNILDEINKKRLVRSDKLNLLFLRGTTGGLELTIEPANEFVLACTCLLTEAPLQGLIPFFNKFHRSSSVRRDREISVQTFADVPSVWPNPLNALAPIPVQP